MYVFYSPVKGSSTAFEFAGVAGDTSGSIGVRYLPYPCQACFNKNPVECSNIPLVGEVMISVMTEIVYDECVNLNAPLAQYTNAILTHFLRSHNIKITKLNGRNRSKARRLHHHCMST